MKKSFKAFQEIREGNAKLAEQYVVNVLKTATNNPQALYNAARVAEQLPGTNLLDRVKDAADKKSPKRVVIREV